MAGWRAVETGRRGNFLPRRGIFLPRHPVGGNAFNACTEHASFIGALIQVYRTPIYLNIIRLNRNTSDGNGAHASYLQTEAQLDAHIKAFLTLYLYVTGMCYDRLKAKYDI